MAAQVKVRVCANAVLYQWILYVPFLRFTFFYLILIKYLLIAQTSPVGRTRLVDFRIGWRRSRGATSTANHVTASTTRRWRFSRSLLGRLQNIISIIITMRTRGANFGVSRKRAKQSSILSSTHFPCITGRYTGWSETSVLRNLQCGFAVGGGWIQEFFKWAPSQRVRSTEFPPVGSTDKVPVRILATVIPEPSVSHKTRTIQTTQNHLKKKNSC